MRKIVIFLFFLVVNTFAETLVLYSALGGWYYYGLFNNGYPVDAHILLCDKYARYEDYRGFYSSNKNFYPYIATYSQYDGKPFNMSCLNYYKFNTFGGCDGSFYPEFVVDFCRVDTHTDCFFSNGYWVCDGEIKCPPGQTYNSTTEECEEMPHCPDSEEFDQMTVDKCKSLDFIAFRQCDPNTGKVTILCKTCDQVNNL